MEVASYSLSGESERILDSTVVQEYAYVYNGSSLMQMVVQTTVDDGAPTTDTLYFSYDASGIPMSLVYNGTDYYYTVSLQGDVTAILNTSGTAVVEYTYDAWGNILTVTGSMADTLGAVNPLTYRGYVYDTETGLYYLQSRYYSPVIGRFINADGYMATGQGLLDSNMFAYCCNNPVIRVDESGHQYSSTEIHNFVLDDICDKHPTMSRKNTYMKYKKKYLWHTYGYCDLYDTRTGEVWEAKRFMGGITCTKVAASAQLQNYVKNGVLVSNPSLSLCTGGTYTSIEPNVFEIMDKDMEGVYIVSYWDASDGIIFYDYVYVPSPKEVANVAIGALTLATYLGLAYCTGGASLGLPLFA